MKTEGNNHKKEEHPDEVQFFTQETFDLSKAYDEMIELYTMLPPFLCKIKNRMNSRNNKKSTANNEEN